MHLDTNGAVMSACETFRYRLWRRWEPESRVLMFVMLNPSTADASHDDPTIRKCIGFAKRLGYGGIEVCNLYAYRATDPRDLKKARYPHGALNDATVLGLAEITVNRGGQVIAAWGAHAQPNRAQDFRVDFACAGIPLHHLGLTKSGQPRHPLMLPYSAQATEWVYA